VSYIFFLFPGNISSAFDNKTVSPILNKQACVYRTVFVVS